MVGAKVAYFSGDILSLMDDVKIVKPTIFLSNIWCAVLLTKCTVHFAFSLQIAVPRLLNKIYDKIQDNVRGNLLKEWMLRSALAMKGRAYREGKLNNNTVWDKLIFNKVRANLGGRIRVVATGSASLNPKVGDAMRSILGCVVIGIQDCLCLLLVISFSL